MSDVPADSLLHRNKSASYWMTRNRPIVQQLATATGQSEWATAKELAYIAGDHATVTDNEATETFMNDHNLKRNEK